MASFLDGLGVDISRLVDLAMQMSRYDEYGVCEADQASDGIELSALVQKIVDSALKLAGISADGRVRSRGLMERHGYTRTNNVVIDEQGITNNRGTTSWPSCAANEGGEYLEIDGGSESACQETDSDTGLEEMASIYKPSSHRHKSRSDDGVHISPYGILGGSKRYRDVEEVVSAYDSPHYSYPKAQKAFAEGTSTRKYTTANDDFSTYGYTKAHDKISTAKSAYW